MSILTRIAATVAATALFAGPWVCVPAGVTSAGTAGDTGTAATRDTGTTTTVADTSLPTSLVNGGFDYPGVLSASDNWASITPDGQRYGASAQWSAIKNFNRRTFGWSSNQVKGTNPEQRAGAVEIQRDVSGNQYGEICAYQNGTAIYQDIDTDNTTDVQYHVSLKHASLSKANIDKMQVLIGVPGREQPVEMTRTKVNGNGDREGEKSDVIATKVANENDVSIASSRNHEGQWETYEATVVIPAGQPVTRFTFRSVSAVSRNLGNLVDDITFEKAYKLSYDGNGGVKSSVSDIADKRSLSESNLVVNGGFDTPSWTVDKTGAGLPWVYVSPDKGTVRSYYQAMSGQTGTKVDGLTSASFAWRDLEATASGQSFELHREKDGNTAADVHAGRTVAQSITTVPGTTYTFSIRHSGRSKGNAGGVTLLTGPDERHLTPVELTRDTVSATGVRYGDVTGPVGTVAWTHSDSSDGTEGSHEAWDHADDWESYSGTVVIPAGQTTTMVAYRGVDKGGQSTSAAADSIIDDLRFEVSFPLSYDANGGVKSSVSAIADTDAAGTGGIVQVVKDSSTTLPRALVNGDFEYPSGLRNGNWTLIRPDNATMYDFGKVGYAGASGWKKIAGFDRSKFGWNSTQTATADHFGGESGRNAIEIQRWGNSIAQIVESQQGTAIYQDIDTDNETAAVYHVSLKHAPMVDGAHKTDKMQVLIGVPGREQPVEMTRVKSNGYGDKVGESSTIVSTTGNSGGLDFDTYEGSVVVPAGQPVTRFTFKSVDSANASTGNQIDDVSFSMAYPLSYDGNGGVKSAVSTVSDGTESTAGTAHAVADRDTKSATLPSHTQTDGTETAAYRPKSDTAGVSAVSDVTVDNADGTATRTTTRSDGSVVVPLLRGC